MNRKFSDFVCLQLPLFTYTYIHTNLLNTLDTLCPILMLQAKTSLGLHLHKNNAITFSK